MFMVDLIPPSLSHPHGARSFPRQAQTERISRSSHESSRRNGGCFSHKVGPKNGNSAGVESELASYVIERSSISPRDEGETGEQDHDDDDNDGRQGHHITMLSAKPSETQFWLKSNFVSESCILN